MPTLVDSNVLVFSANPSSPFYEESRDATQSLLERGERLCVLPQNLYEFWVVATRPVSANGLAMTTTEAQAELVRIKRLFRFLPDTPAIYSEWEKLVGQYSVSGTKSHDARIVAAMNVHGIKQLLTFDVRDFKRYLEITITSPADVKPEIREKD